MADVQLENGHVRIANRLIEAILDADFTGAQVRILLALVRLTFGWRRRTVSITVPELARLAKLSPTGGFRRAFHDLIEHGVVLEVKEGRTITYAIQKDFTHWGEYGGNEGRLSALWDKRPVSDDDLLKHAVSTGQLALLGAGSAGETMPPEGQTPQGNDPTGSGSVTPQGQTALPDRDMGSGPKSLFDETVAPPKDRKDRKDIGLIDGTHASGGGDEAEEQPASATELAVWINLAVKERWPTSTRMYTAGGSAELERDLRERGIPKRIAKESIFRQARGSRDERPFGTPSYFLGGIVGDFETSVMRGEIARAAGTEPPRAQSPPATGSARRRGFATAAASTPAPPSTRDQSIDFDK